MCSICSYKIFIKVGSSVAFGAIMFYHIWGYRGVIKAGCSVTYGALGSETSVNWPCTLTSNVICVCWVHVLKAIDLTGFDWTECRIVF